VAKKDVSMESLKAFVRKEAARFLKQENITSVGIGYKIKDGKPTKEISIQFTVGRKVAPEGLEALGAVEIPKSFTIGGVEVPTDVLERNYGKAAREVKLEAKLEAASARKGFANPIVPGISIGHPKISAGTAGCVVYDAQSGSPYVLSNWHVLNGPEGNIGDPIVQPGTYDDNRVERNIAGRLVRSYLGIAGDCAIAAIDQRRLEPEILDLGTAVNRIGEPELGDRVVKSGRTTNVTYGIVNRIHTTVRINYEQAGDQEIGCFEIGPDLQHPARNGEISMGGDSGSAWLFLDADKPSDMMVGLHFAGEVGDAPEHALACYPASVFEKLGIQPKAPDQLVFIDQAERGYSPSFVGAPVPLPTLADPGVDADALSIGGRTVLDYTHFSLSMSRSRRFARWVAWNIDGGSLRRLSRSGLRFRKDRRIPADAQVGNDLYANNALDRGHIARRADLVWGTLAEARKANSDSFYFTNITPQHAEFNQSAANGIWGGLEDAIFEDVDVADLRISVIGGPIFSDNDPLYRGVALPRQFWKVVYFREAGASSLEAKAFVLTQADLLNQLEVLELPEFSVYEVPLAQLSEMVGLRLAAPAAPEAFATRGGRRAEAARPAARRIESVRDIVGSR